jgi:hypothetical protein
MFQTRNLKRSAALVLFGVASVGACSSDDSGNAATTSTTSTTSTPIVGTFIGEFGGDPCTAAGDEVAVVIAGSGEMGDLGTLHLRIDATAVCASTQGLDRVTVIAGSYTAENGDVLTFTGTGSTITATDAEATLTFTETDSFTGGTGRFAGATGQQTVTYLHDFSAMQLTVEVDGEILTAN